MLVAAAVHQSILARETPLVLVAQEAVVLQA